jgi:hypothetical protein
MLSTEIELIVNKLLELKKKHTISEIDSISEFDEFKKVNKLLYETVLGDTMDISIFKQMMKMKRKLEDGEDQYSVDVKFGKYMAEKFIDPIVNDPNTPTINKQN